MKRRQFLKRFGAGVLLSTLPGTQSWAMPQLFNKNDEIIIKIFLRGGCDGLHLVGPTSDRYYADARNRALRLGDGDEQSGLRLKNPLDNIDFRLHPKAAALKEIYDDNQLAIIHACGLTNGTRSHFEAMDMIERGINQKSGAKEGWMNRYLQQVDFKEHLLPAVSIGDTMPLSMLGSEFASSMRNLEDYKVHGDPRLGGILRSFYQGNSQLDRVAQQTIYTVNQVQKRLPKDDDKVQEYEPEHGVEYPNEWYMAEFSNSLKNLARLIKMDVGVHLAQVDYGGWDTHDGQGHHFPRLVEGLSEALAAFYNDLSHYHQRLTILVMSEFGRRLRSNKSMGTDHGHGGIAMVLGGSVKGGRMYGNWPGLATENLDNGVDLAITTDYRTILGEIMRKKSGQVDLDKLFPKFSLKQELGFLKA
ncbi:MAG: DUF1501 domain-containing protein [Saprospiraceae bacterium]|nr:DUF1501 domain-containing protein [Saprospiraceae bacterium]